MAEVGRAREESAGVTAEVGKPTNPMVTLNEIVENGIWNFLNKLIGFGLEPSVMAAIVRS